jgi:hypothetical protein
MFGKTLLFALTIQISAFAGIITYNYTGNAFNGCQVGNCSSLTNVTVSLTFAAPLAASTGYVWGNSGQSGVALTPLSWSMFNGQDSVTPLVSDPNGTNGSFIIISTDSFGAIGTWVVQGRDQDPGYTGPLPRTTISTGNSLTIFDDDSTSSVVSGFSPQYVGFIDHQPGSWRSVGAAAPEPGTIGLALLGGMCLLARRLR